MVEEERQRWREKPAVLCDVFKRLLVLFYLDKGMEEIQRFLDQVIVLDKDGRYELITQFQN